MPAGPSVFRPVAVPISCTRWAWPLPSEPRLARVEGGCYEPTVLDCRDLFLSRGEVRGGYVDADELAAQSAGGHARIAAPGAMAELQPNQPEPDTPDSLAVLKTAAKGTMSCTGGSGSPRLGTYLARRAAHDTAARHHEPGRWLLPELGWDRCQVMTGNPFGTDVCHLMPLRPGDISVTNDLQRRTGQGRHGP
jgi:hypothetical protein